MIFEPIHVTCPHCHAEPGHLCKTPRGHLLTVRGNRDDTNFHARRLNAAQDATDYKATPLMEVLAHRMPKKLAHKVRCHSHAWCDAHGEIHSSDGDPYGDRPDDCKPINWRRVYVETDDKKETF